MPELDTTKQTAFETWYQREGHKYNPAVDLNEKKKVYFGMRIAFENGAFKALEAHHKRHGTESSTIKELTT